MSGFLEHLGGVQQRLRWNAADVEAGAAVGGALLDHRLIDGREAVTALKTIKEAIEDPTRLLIDL